MSTASKRCCQLVITASPLVSDRAYPFHSRGYDHFSVALSVGVQKWCARFSLLWSDVFDDTETGFQMRWISAAYGLGENVVQGSVNPDEYFVFKPTLKQVFAQF